MVISSKYPGKCKRCGKPFAAGDQIEWEKAAGATHLTTDVCAEAPDALPPVVLKLASDEDPAEREMAEQILLSKTYKVASTMPGIPHAYTLRKNWDSQDDFIWIIDYMRKVGYQQKFGRKVYTYYDVGDYQYWDCGGDPLHGGEGGVDGINRALRKPALF